MVRSASSAAVWKKKAPVKFGYTKLNGSELSQPGICYFRPSSEKQMEDFGVSSTSVPRQQILKLFSFQLWETNFTTRAKKIFSSSSDTTDFYQNQKD